jgi:hypothetical protein
MPQVQDAAAAVWDQQRYLNDIGEVVAKQYQDVFKAVAVPKVDLPRFEVPALKLDYTTLFPDIAAVQQQAAKALRPSLDFIHDLQREQFADLIAATRKALQSALPPNWRDDSISIPKELETLLLDEGLALAWVPPTDILVRIFAPSTPAERRRVIGRRWKRIGAACVEHLDLVQNEDLKGHVKFAHKAARSLLDGSPESSQALSANLLDTILRSEFSEQDRQTITGQEDRLNIEDYPVRVAIVLGAIWGAHGQYWPARGDKVPRGFSRHGSAHGVSRRQYSRINAVLALMPVVALLRLLDTDLR